MMTAEGESQDRVHCVRNASLTKKKLAFFLLSIYLMRENTLLMTQCLPLEALTFTLILISEAVSKTWNCYALASSFHLESEFSNCKRQDKETANCLSALSSSNVVFKNEEQKEKTQDVNWSQLMSRVSQSSFLCSIFEQNKSSRCFLTWLLRWHNERRRRHYRSLFSQKQRIFSTK